MSRWARSRAAVVCLVVLTATTLRAADEDQQALNREFQAAVAEYDAGRYAEAAARLEQLLPQVRNSFEVHEMLGLSYASLSRDQDAIRELQSAVRLRPGSAEARTNLAASLSHAGETELAGEQFRKALALEPDNYTANHNLGEYYVGTGKLAEAVPLLAHAQKINPAAYDNGYDLATAQLLTGNLLEARQVAEKLLALRDTGELHNLLGQIDEKQGNFLAAAHDYETAARIDPSDDNLFAWGGELLIHRTYEPAVTVFRYATQRYPDSPRLQIGLGMALYARGLYQDSVTALLKAVDLAPDDARCYQFLARSYDRSPQQADDVIERFRRYAELQPGNARAQYYYAMSLWKGKQLEDASFDSHAVEELLRKSIALDATFPDVYFQLGNFYADQHQYEKSIPEYQRALQLNPNLPDAHYRLGIDYVHTGNKDRAQEELAVYQKLRSQDMAQDDRERAEVRQFIVSAKSAAQP